MSRVNLLESYLKEDPEDPFNHYALALEYLKTDAPRAMKHFEKLLADHPAYLPTYYPFAHLLIEMKNPGRGEQVFQLGIEKARQAGDAKTLRELQAAYNDWLFLKD
jgi:Tfp pilus assembly protein PilF